MSRRTRFIAALSRLAEGVGIALDAVRSNKVRAALTILGVAIGVMVVIGIASMITGINRAVMKEVESLGPKTFFVQRYFQGGLEISDGSDELSPWRRNPWVTVEEAEMVRRLPLVQEVTWREDTNGPVSYQDQKLSSVNIVGMNPPWIGVAGGTITSGRNFNQAEYAAGSHVAVINDYVAERFFPGRDPLGKRIKIYGQPFDVVGVYVDAQSLFGSSKQPVLILPHTAFTKVADYWKGWLMFLVDPVEGASVSDAQDQVIAAMRAARGLKPAQENNFAVVTQEKMLDTWNSITRGFFLVMLALSSVGLMVGGVGVVAIMMISVTERTREIGVRKALGATRREVMFQFLVEAATLTLLGGAVGMALGSAIAWLVNKFTPIPAAVPLWSVVVAITASVVTGVFFGLYPASKASRLDPVEALRYE
jgi:putative ABC transport system permease protein